MHFFFLSQTGSSIHQLRRHCCHRRRIPWKPGRFDRYLTQNAPIRTRLQTQRLCSCIPIAIQLSSQRNAVRSCNSLRLVRRKTRSVDRNQMRRTSRSHFSGSQKARPWNSRIYLWTLLCKSLWDLLEIPNFLQCLCLDRQRRTHASSQLLRKSLQTMPRKWSTFYRRWNSNRARQNWW